MIRTPFARLIPLLVALVFACSSADDTTPDIGTSDTVVVAPDADSRDILITERDLGAEVDECGSIGCACTDDESCDAGPCVLGVDGESFCSVWCDGLCPVSGYACRSVLEESGELRQVCVPRAELCLPCGDGQSCGTYATECVAHDDGEFCASRCRRDGTCPYGAECVQVDGESVCLPRGGACQECLDPDEDGYGIGLGCLGADCDESRPERNEGAIEVCNDVDDDCDGLVDEGFDKDTDLANCGACGAVCEVAKGAPVCVAGVCQVRECEGSWRDCNGDPSDGCEFDVWSEGFCGVCERPALAPGLPCGTCGLGVRVCAEDGTTVCEGDPGPSAENACGGCTTLGNVPGAPCGPCGLDVLVCDGGERLKCSGATLGSECGGCRVLEGSVGDPCGTCSRGTLECSGVNALECVGDPGPSARNACGGCGVLDGLPGEPCEACPVLEKVCDGLNALACPEYGCCPGQEREVPCERCGTTTEVCGSDARWQASETCDQPTCCPGDSATRPCSECGDQTRHCSPSGTWGSWGTCVLPTCCPGAEDVAPCGACGFRTRTCSAEETWNEWSSCAEPECCSGQVEQGACNECGERSRTCTLVNTWGSWSACAGDPAGECDSGTCGASGYCE